jgi:hypothetical protein
MDKHVFFDLDETLFFTGMVTADNESELDKTFNPIVSKLNSDLYYVSYLRPGALKLIEEVRKVIPEERIFVMTRGAPDYAEWANEGHKLGFHPSRIYHDKHVSGKHTVQKLTFPVGVTPRAYLLDDLPRHELGLKLTLLHRRLGFPIDQLYTYRIPAYSGPREDDPNREAISDAEIADVVAYIKGMTPNEPKGIPYSPWG